MLLTNQGSKHALLSSRCISIKKSLVQLVSLLSAWWKIKIFINSNIPIRSPLLPQPQPWGATIENRIYIRVEFTRKKCKTAILLYCFHTADLLHIFVLYNLLGPGTSFCRKSKTNIKWKPNYEIGWFHNWPMTISHRLSLYKWWFSVITNSFY